MIFLSPFYYHLLLFLCLSFLSCIILIVLNVVIILISVIIYIHVILILSSVVFLLKLKVEYYSCKFKKNYSFYLKKKNISFFFLNPIFANIRRSLRYNIFDLEWFFCLHFYCKHEFMNKLYMKFLVKCYFSFYHTTRPFTTIV